MSGSTFPGRAGANPFGAQNNQPGSINPSRVLEEDENDPVTSPTTPSFAAGRNGPMSSMGGMNFSGDAAPETPSFSPGIAEGFPAHYGMGRRTSVSAESLNPTASSNDNWTPPFHPKTAEQLARLKSSIAGNFLFNHLDDEQSAQVLGALVEKPIPTKDIKVCSSNVTRCNIADHHRDHLARRPG